MVKGQASSKRLLLSAWALLAMVTVAAEAIIVEGKEKKNDHHFDAGGSSKSSSSSLSLWERIFSFGIAAGSGGRSPNQQPQAMRSAGQSAPAAGSTTTTTTTATKIKRGPLTPRYASDETLEASRYDRMKLYEDTDGVYPFDREQQLLLASRKRKKKKRTDQPKPASNSIQGSTSAPSNALTEMPTKLTQQEQQRMLSSADSGGFSDVISTISSFDALQMSDRFTLCMYLYGLMENEDSSGKGSKGKGGKGGKDDEDQIVFNDEALDPSIITEVRIDVVLQKRSEEML